MGAAAIGNWRTTSTPIAAAHAEPSSLDWIDAEVANVLTPQDPSSQVAEPLAEVKASPLRSWGESRVTLSFGVSLATALTLNVVFSDPIAGFDYLATRFDREARKPSRGRRPPDQSLGR
jgi:hypothetical protein